MIEREKVEAWAQTSGPMGDLARDFLEVGRALQRANLTTCDLLTQFDMLRHSLDCERKHVARLQADLSRELKRRAAPDMLPRKMPRCRTCAAWGSIGAQEGYGDCRRRAPVSVGDRKGWKEDAPAWPRTHLTHGCYDHIPADLAEPSGLPAHEVQ